MLDGKLYLTRGVCKEDQIPKQLKPDKKVCVPEIALHSLAPLINFIFPLRKKFSDLVGGRVGHNPVKARIAPPPPPSITKQSPGSDTTGSRRAAFVALQPLRCIAVAPVPWPRWSPDLKKRMGKAAKLKKWAEESGLVMQYLQTAGRPVPVTQVQQALGLRNVSSVYRYLRVVAAHAQVPGPGHNPAAARKQNTLDLFAATLAASGGQMKIGALSGAHARLFGTGFEKMMGNKLKVFLVKNGYVVVDGPKIGEEVVYSGAPATPLGPVGVPVGGVLGGQAAVDGGGAAPVKRPLDLAAGPVAKHFKGQGGGQGAYAGGVRAQLLGGTGGYGGRACAAETQGSGGKAYPWEDGSYTPPLPQSHASGSECADTRDTSTRLGGTHTANQLGTGPAHTRRWGTPHAPVASRRSDMAAAEGFWAPQPAASVAGPPALPPAPQPAASVAGPPARAAVPAPKPAAVAPLRPYLTAQTSAAQAQHVAHADVHRRSRPRLRQNLHTRRAQMEASHVQGPAVVQAQGYQQHGYQPQGPPYHGYKGRGKGYGYGNG